MAMSSDVTLPKSQVPCWPRECVICGRTDGLSHTRLTTHSVGWWTLAFWTFGQRFFVEVHSDYAGKFALLNRSVVE
jgi:hypothetical protein